MYLYIRIPISTTPFCYLPLWSSEDDIVEGRRQDYREWELTVEIMTFSGLKNHMICLELLGFKTQNKKRLYFVLRKG